MYVWRISKHDDLFGRGGLIASGRWHTLPRPVVYCSDDAHTAYCEVLRQFVHPSLIPDDARLLKIECPDNIKIETIEMSKLDRNWNSDTIGWRICRPIGDEWLRSGRTVLLKVPSAARPGSFNYLLNPASHRAQDVVVADVVQQPFPEFVTTGAT